MKGTAPSHLYLITAVAAAIAATTFIATSARADDITIDNSPLVSSKSRQEVLADLKKPYVGGYPWSSQYNMGVKSGERTVLDSRREYLTSRDEVRALGAEDGGSSYFSSTAGRAPTSTMGGPPR